jgi:uncharacterized protein
MELIEYRDPRILRTLIEPRLLEDEAQNNLFLGLLIHYCEHPDLQENEHFWFSIENKGEIQLAGWRTPPFPFGLWAPEGNWDPALKCFLDYIKEKNKEVPGVVAQKHLADTFATLAKAAFNLKTYFTMEQGLYECREVDQSLMGSGTLRQVKPSELDLLTDWIIAFYIDVLNREPLRSETRERIATEIESGMYFFYEIEGQPVSTAAFARPMKNGITINMVYTPNQFRRKGYATSCVAQLTQKLLEQRWKFTALYTDLNNPTSNSIYQKIGYRRVGDSAEIRLKPVTRR